MIQSKGMKNDHAIAIAFAANHSFVPYFAACLQSLLTHSSSENRYDLVLLHTDITREDQKWLLEMTIPYPNASLRFYDVKPLICHYNLKATGHISVETYFRFLIQEIMPEYDKVLYLDSDMIINADVAALYQTDVEGYLLAAVRDPEFLGHLHGANRRIQRYILGTLKLNNPQDYFQAGVILFNTKELRKTYTIGQWLSFSSEPYMYNDQDVLNLYCQGRAKILDMSWNVLTDCNHTRISQVIAYAPESIQMEYFEARRNPRIIHYAGYRKPWQNPSEDMGEYFWHVARTTPFYEVVLRNMVQYTVMEKRRDQSLYGWLRRLAKRIIKGRRKSIVV